MVDSIRDTYYRWSINDLTKCHNNNLIISFIMNIKAESSNHMEKSLTICYCQVDQFDCSYIGDIKQVNEDILSS